MVYYSDGYEIKGKFSSNTGVSGAKKKGNFKGYGYKGKKKKAPKETKTYMTAVTGDPSKDKADPPLNPGFILSPSFLSVSFIL